MFILLLLLEPNFSQFFSVAPDGTLSRQVKKMIEDIIKCSPALAGTAGRHRFKLLRSNILCLLNDNDYIPLNYSRDRMDAREPSVFLVDEAGALPEAYAIEAMRSGQINIANKLGCVISTKYPRINNPFEDEVEHAKKKFNGIVCDDSLFALLYEPDNTRDWMTDDGILEQGNPLAIEIPEIMEEIKKKRAAAIERPSARENFVTKHCNIIYQGVGTESYVDLKAFTGAMPQVNTAISGIFSGDTGAATQLTTGLTQMFTGMITNLSESLPNLLSSINQIVTSLLSALGAALPTLTSTLIPALISGLTGLVNAIIQQVPVLLPLLVEAALQLFTSLLTGLNEVLPTLLAMLPEIITKVSDTIIANLPMLIDAGIQLIVTLAQGLPKAIPALVEKLPEIISAIIDGLMSQDWLQIGIDILSGILDGLVAGIKKIPEAISKIGSSILNGFKSFFGIASPSKLMKKAVGFNLADGIGVGFVDEMERVNQEMQAALPRSFETEASVKVNGVLNTNPGGNGFDGSAGSLDNSVNQTVNIYANTPLSPAETARQLRNVNRQLARQIRSA